MTIEIDVIDFVIFLKSVLRNTENVERWARHLINNHDFSASNRIEISGSQTKSGNPEFFTF